MCLIIHKPNPKSVIPQTYIDNAKRKNPDGFGIVYTDTFECFTTMDYAEADKLIAESRPFVAHYRYATKGTIDITNCHPFIIDDDHYLFSNGTVASLGDDKICDTQRVCELLARIPRSHWQDVLQFTDTRFAIVNASGTVTRHGKWHKKGQLWYSKTIALHSTNHTQTRASVTTTTKTSTCLHCVLTTKSTIYVHTTT